MGGAASSGWWWPATMAVSLLVLVLVVAGVKSWTDLRSSRERVRELALEVETVSDSVDGLRNSIRQLRTDSRLLERVAREELGLVRPDEIVVILPEEVEKPSPNP